MREAIPSITKEEIEWPEDGDSKYNNSIIMEREVLNPPTHKMNNLPSSRDDRDVVANTDGDLGQIKTIEIKVNSYPPAYSARTIPDPTA